MYIHIILYFVYYVYRVYIAKNTGFKDFGEFHLYSFVDTGIWAKGVPSLNLNFFNFSQLLL